MLTGHSESKSSMNFLSQKLSETEDIWKGNSRRTRIFKRAIILRDDLKAEASDLSQLPSTEWAEFQDVYEKLMSSDQHDEVEFVLK